MEGRGHPMAAALPHSLPLIPLNPIATPYLAPSMTSDPVSPNYTPIASHMPPPSQTLNPLTPAIALPHHIPPSSKTLTHPGLCCRFPNPQC